MKLRRTVPPVEVAAGEKLLAHAVAPEGPVAATRVALYLPGGRRIPWEQVEAADWDLDSETLRVSEVGTWGEVRPSYTFTLAEPTRLLQLVRERVTASVVLQRHVTLGRRRGLRVIARRAPSGAGGVQWVYEYDEGVDPDDDVVRRTSRDTLEAMRRDVGPP